MPETKPLKHPESQTVQGIDVERVLLFSDAIFAFAITLLAIDIRVPQDLLASQLNNQIYALLPKFISFLLSFYIVGSYWISFHRTVHVIKRYDRGLIYLNLLFLMFIVLLPFPNDLIGKYPANLVTVIIYALFLAATGISLCLLWVYASRKYRLIDETIHPDFIRRLTLRLLISPAIFAISILIAFVSPLTSMISWFFGFPLSIYYERARLFKKVHKE
ncbi:MAG TPA: TMEM175 family protein [Candidatus Thermoplasmatota archaeon]|nr:TMEM175 family protein [Candidatus Thermoplasmatota archaeon]